VVDYTLARGQVSQGGDTSQANSERVALAGLTGYVSYQLHVNRYAFAADYVGGKRVLDVACGPGYGSAYLGEKGAKLVIGGDISRDAVREANSRFQGDSVFFVELDAASLPFYDNFFEVAMSFETIEHLDDYRSYLSEYRRVLVPGGVFICSTPNRLAYPKTLHSSFHVREFSAQEFSPLLAEYFTRLTLYYQLSVNRASRIKERMFVMAGRLLSRMPGGLKAKDFIKQAILHTPDISSSYQWESEGIESALDKDYGVKTLDGSRLSGIPDPLIAVAYKA
jgi:ubiquinone/menaquinone biosynthesis C-methylase UbiE